MDNYDDRKLGQKTGIVKGKIKQFRQWTSDTRLDTRLQTSDIRLRHSPPSI